MQSDDIEIVLNFGDDVGPASAYSLLLAENIPDLTGKTAVDLGTGSGILAIIASLQGAQTVYLLDTYDKAISLALENGKRNGVEDRLIHLPIGASMLPLPAGKKVDVILSNPAQLPLPQQDRENSPFYAGPDGRSMIDALIREAPIKLNYSGCLLMTHNSLANLSKSLIMLKSAGLQPRILAERSIHRDSSIVPGSTNWAGRPRACTRFETAPPTRRCTLSMRLLSTSRFSVDGGFWPP